ncbi:MAG: purine-nucleoside phosphorylase [Rhodothermales bacterium]|nr:purine-nucleoside phosphorylase [Rhodothermales bacterium]
MIVNTVEAIEVIRKRTDLVPEIALVLGSGLGNLADALTDVVTIASSDLPGYPQSTVEGHSGSLLFGRLEGRDVLFLKGRVHFYEGYDIQEVVFPISLIARLGIRNLLVTNAAGGSNPSFLPGTIMFIEDHINFGFANPLIGHPGDGPRFPDMSAPYDRDWIADARDIATGLQIRTAVGTYFWTPGPSYETPAEVRAYRTLGADAIGMSTVPEVTAARYYGLRVLGISTITNKAAGISPTALSHAEVLEVGQTVRHDLEKLIRGIVKHL